MKQKNIFLESEGDAWFFRNRESIIQRNFASDRVVNAIQKVVDSDPNSKKIIEIGCGNGLRLKHLKDNMGLDVQGIDPSAMAIQDAKRYGLNVVQGTADDVPCSSGEFDIVVFGFCLYLCDREDLFKIAYETDRILKQNGWIIILDFHSDIPVNRPYHHKPGVFTYKMDYSKLFSWHPNYSLYYQELFHHVEKKFTDEENEHIALNVIRKK